MTDLEQICELADQGIGRYGVEAISLIRWTFHVNKLNKKAR